MANKELKVVITVDDKASKGLQNVEKSTESLVKSIKKAAIASTAFTTAFALGARSVIKAASEMESSMLGLNTVAKAFGEDAGEATDAAKGLANDGLLSVKDAAAGLKNLLATGFSLPQAIKLMEGFKDSAAFNRQGTLAFGEAIVGATQGLKNQNSIMVDNAGVTKNLSNILKEAGFSATDLGLVTSDTAVRTALYNGILKETAIFAGDAERATGTYQGQMAALNTAVFNLKAAIGAELLPVLTSLIEEHLIPLINKTQELVEFFKEHETATVILAGAILGALTPAVIALTGAFAALAVTLAPFIIAGGIIATIVAFIDFLSKEITGFGLLDQLKATFELVKIAAQGVIDKVNEVLSLIDKLNNKISNSKLGKKVGKDFEFLLKGAGFFQHGGTVPGAFNQPVPAILHGGERVVPRTGVDVNPTGSSESVTVNFNGPISAAKQDLDAITRAVKMAIDRESTLFAQGAL